MAKLFRTVTEMRQYPCRTCGAKPGESCRSLTAGRNTNPHQSRWEPEYGGDFADDEKPAQPRAYSFTRAELVDVLARLEAYPATSGDGKRTFIVAESMADAIIGALEEKPEPVHYRWPVVCAGQIPGTKWTGNLDRVTCAACCAITAERLENERRG